MPMPMPMPAAVTLIGVLRAGDVLGCDALTEVALLAAKHPRADFIYADDSRISPASGEREPFFKPDWSPDLLLSTNYIGRTWFADAEMLLRAGIAAQDLAKAGDYDLVLRATEQATEIRHIQKLLCLSAADSPDNAEAESEALVAAMKRRNIAADILPGRAPGAWRCRRRDRAVGRVSIILPTCAAHGYIKTCIETLRTLTAYANYEIVVIDNIPDSLRGWKDYVADHADRVVAMPGAFNWSRFNNHAAAGCQSEFLLFLNDDIEIVDPGWLDALLEHAQRPEVGAVGPQLLFPDRKVQHAGMFLATLGIARHAFRFASEHEPGYFGLALTQRNVMAVTGACMLVRREVFETLGGFDESHEVVANDLDFCLRLHAAGLRTVYTPHATLIHHEFASRDRLPDVFDAKRFEQHWKTLFAAGDPYFNPHLNLQAEDYQPDEEPVVPVFAGGALFRREEIQRILLVKLDHIGDFITAWPAIRRLRGLFPAAKLFVLGSPAGRSFLPPDVDFEAFIGFEFFHARSALGKVSIESTELAALEARLASFRFDLAIDLRKHLDTRDILKHTGARLLCGFDHQGQFPFLDIALEWAPDRAMERKRSHVAEDLLNLVEAVGNAAASAPVGHGALATVRSDHPPTFLPPKIRLLWQRPVVAIHPGAGNDIKLWGATHFAALIDLLIEKDHVNVVLIGSPVEKELAAAVRRQIVHQDRVASVAGLFRLERLPALLASCALFIGNDSGPKHIAANLGVPTIGLHAGNVDPAEWAPVGRRSVAMWRAMTCSPCYLSRVEDCPRGVACMSQLEPALVHQMAQSFLARPIA